MPSRARQLGQSTLRYARSHPAVASAGAGERGPGAGAAPGPDTTVADPVERLALNPAVVTPDIPGQQRQARRLEAAGADLALPMGEAAPEDVTAAVGLVLSDPAYALGAHRLREEIAAMPSASQVAERLVASVG